MKGLGGSRRTRFGSFIVDGQGTLLGFDEAMESLTGWSAFELVGRGRDLRLPVEAASGRMHATGGIPLFEEALAPVWRPTRTTMSINCRDRRRLELEALVRPLEGPGERMLVNVLGVLARSPIVSGPTGQQHHDRLTGLIDGNGFGARLAADFARANAGARPLSVIILDVDRLREVNDLGGRSSGDEVLRRLAGILRVAVDDDERIARLGEDDFAIILPDNGRGDARQLAASLRSNVERSRLFESGDEERSLTISLGTASFPADADTPSELVARAREALEEARQLGRNRVWCYLRRPRVNLEVPVFFDATAPMLFGFSRDVSPSGIFIQTSAAIDVGMRCALTFPLPGEETRVHVVGRVVRSVRPHLEDDSADPRVPGLGLEFERFGGDDDRRSLDVYLHTHESATTRPETGPLSV